MTHVLNVSRLSKRYKSVVALDDVSIEVTSGEVVALVGENGAGKSTLIRCIARDETPDAGLVSIDGLEVGPNPAGAKGSGVFTVWQDLGLCDNLDTVANLFLGNEHGRFTMNRSRMHAEAVTLLDELDLTFPDLRMPVSLLSGGQRQLVALARAFLNDPAVLLLDEPTAALGVAETATVEKLIRRLALQGTAVVLVSHQVDQVLRVADRVVVMRHGSVVADASRQELNYDDLGALMSGQPIDSTASRQLRRLHSLVDQLADADASMILPLTVSAIATAVGVEMLCVHLVEETPAGPRLARSAAVGIPEQLLKVNANVEFGAQGASVGLAAESGEIVVIEDIRVDPRWNNYRRAAQDSDVASTWAVPISGINGVLGTVSGYSRGPGSPADDQLELVALFANQAGVALDRGQLLRQLTERNAVLEALRSILETMAGPTIEAGMSIALLALCRGLNSDSAGIYTAVDSETFVEYSTMVANPGTDDARSSALRLHEVARQIPAEKTTTASWHSENTAYVAFHSPTGPALLLADWAAVPETRVQLLEILGDAAKSFQLAMEREHLMAEQQETVALRRSNQLQRAFVSRLSHELRTPLTTINGYASSLRQSDIEWGPAERQRFLDGIVTQSARLNRLVADLLDFTAIEAGILRLRIDWCDVRLVMDAAINAIDNSQTVSVTTLQEGMQIRADHDRLQQVFVNLIGNALRHGPDGTAVSIEIMKGIIENTVAIRISDDGGGLPSAVATSLVQRRNEKMVDVGLGLQIARGIIEAHGGSIVPEQTTVGTSLMITLPIEPSATDLARGVLVDVADLADV
jgi:ABC-type multidrug transport system ATPase subunit/signal transduction histidine kinase